MPLVYSIQLSVSVTQRNPALVIKPPVMIGEMVHFTRNKWHKLLSVIGSVVLTKMITESIMLGITRESMKEVRTHTHFMHICRRCFIWPYCHMYVSKML